MYKIAVMGDRDSIYGFASLGLEPFPLTDPAEAGKKVKDLAESGYAVIYITEALAAQIEPEINRYREAGLPAIILIPGISGNTGKGILAVKKSVEHADFLIHQSHAPCSKTPHPSNCYTNTKYTTNQILCPDFISQQIP